MMVSPTVQATLLQFDLGPLVNGLYAGISFGMILVLTASGLSLIFGLMGVVNFAHGQLYAVGAYLGFFMFGITGNYVFALIAAALGGLVVGSLVEVSVVRPLYDRDPVYHLPATFGVGIILVEAVKIFFGSQQQQFLIPSYLSGQFTVAGFNFGLYRLFLISIGTTFILGLALFLRRTKYGLIIRAAIFDTEMVRSMGYDVSRIYTAMFALGTAYAAIAGVLIAPLFGLYPEMGAEIIIIAFVVVVTGGLGSFKGVIVAGLVLGLAVSLGRVYTPTIAEAIPFLLMVIVISVRPRGLFGVEGVFTE